MGSLFNWIIFFLVFAIVLYVLVNLMNDKFNKNIKQGNIFYFRKFLVKKHEKALLLKEGDFQNLLVSGIYWYFDPLKKLELLVYDLSQPLFEGKYLDLLIKNNPDLVEKHLTVVNLKDNETGLLYQDQKLKQVLPPGTKKAFWNGIIDTTFEIIDIEKDYELPESKLDNIIHLPGTFEKIALYEIKDYQVGLLYVNSKFIKSLNSGLYAYWKFNKFIDLKFIDLRIQPLEVNGQEIMTKDKVSLRINLSSSYKIIDPIKVINDVVDYKDYIYIELQHSLREAAGIKTLDELLANKDEINTNVFNSTVEKLRKIGIELLNVGVKDIILPGDMRNIMNQVVEAEKLAQANLIKRREETAATRSQLNTAKMMEDNPVVLRLKELETLERITEKIDKITVLGGLDSILNELVKLKQ